jgi:hypothetical protein
MPTRSQTFRRLVLTASLVSLAAAMPLWAAVPLSVAADFAGIIDPQPEEVTHATPADHLLELVSRAARRLCRTPAVANWPAAGSWLLNPELLTWRCPPPGSIGPAPRLCAPHLIDQPPPQA